MQSIILIQKLFLKDDQVFLTRLCRELLGRDPDSAKDAELVGFLQAGGSKEEVLRKVIFSDEFARLFSKPPRINQRLREIMTKDDYEFFTLLAYEMFGEKLDLAAQIQQQEQFIQSKFTKTEILRRQLMVAGNYKKNFLSEISSAEKNSISEVLKSSIIQDDPTFLTRIYQELLDRDPQSKEIEAYNQANHSEMARTELIEKIIQSPELGELVEKAPLKRHINFMQKFNHMNDEVFVTAVYRDCLNREPDSGGFDSYVRELKAGESRVNIYRIFLLSDEARRAYYLKKKNKFKHHFLDDVAVDIEFREKVKNLMADRNFPFETNILIKTGGMGDFVQMTAVAKALKVKYPERPIVAIVGTNSLFSKHPYVDLAIEYGSVPLRETVKSMIGLAENIFDLRYISCAYGTWENTKYFFKNRWFYDNFPSSSVCIDTLKKHVCDLMLYSLGLEQYASCNDILVIPDDVPEKIPHDYIVICNSSGLESGNLKHWPAARWGQLIEWLHSEGIIPVQLGTASDKLLHPGVIDLRGKTSQRQAAGYLKLSKGYVGIEGGIYNLAQAVKAPTVVIMTATPRVCYAYPDSQVVTREICHPCLWVENAWYQGQCPYGHKTCLNSPDWEMVSQAVTKMLNLQN